MLGNMERLKAIFGEQKINRVLKRDRVLNSFGNTTTELFWKSLNSGSSTRLSTLDLLVIIESGQYEQDEETPVQVLEVLCHRHLRASICRLDDWHEINSVGEVLEANRKFRKAKFEEMKNDLKEENYQYKVIKDFKVRIQVLKDSESDAYGKLENPAMLTAEIYTAVKRGCIQEWIGETLMSMYMIDEELLAKSDKVRLELLLIKGNSSNTTRLSNSEVE